MKVYINFKHRSLLPHSYLNMLKKGEEIYIGNVYYKSKKRVLVKLKSNIYGWSDTDSNYLVKELGITLEQGRYWWFPINSVIYKNNLIMDTE